MIDIVPFPTFHKSLLFTLFFLLLSFSFSEATIRYVSHTGTSTPPYTSWLTAANSIQKCIDYSVAGDTIIVANGSYKETLFINKEISLTGSDMDSTIIDGRGLEGVNYSYLTVEIGATVHMIDFTIIGKAPTGSVAMMASAYSYPSAFMSVENCKILDCEIGIEIGGSSSVIKNSYLVNIASEAINLVLRDSNYPKIEGCLILMENSPNEAISLFDFGHPIISNNIILGINSYYGISVAFGVTTLIIKNNIVSGFEASNIYAYDSTDSTIIQNNLVIGQLFSGLASIYAGPEVIIKNNIIAYSRTGVSGGIEDYNLYWQNNTNTTGGLAEHDIIANPMFVNDTIPVYGGTFDFHLQKYSPAIDAGDPNILDVDGTRSDIGVFGGPLGEEYTYQDLAPRPPVNVTAVLDSNQVLLSWNKNTEADFSSYRIYRDTTEGFIIDSTKMISEQSDTFFVQILPKDEINLYYKITAVDSQGNQSGPSEEKHILITSIKTKKTITLNDYKLYQNYPNPFNPSTKIGYRLKERGYVKLYVYDIKGEMIEVLVNKVQEAGYHEVNFGVKQDSSPEIASGIYLYRIEVIGEGRIPRFSDMKKMILLK